MLISKKEFIERLSLKGYTKKDSEIITNDVIKTIEEYLVNGDSVRFFGFGAFEICERASRESVSPATGERVFVPPYKAVRFAPSKKLKRQIKTGTLEE